MADPLSLTAVSLGASALGGATSAFGAISGGNSQAGMYQYQAGVAQMNQQIMKQNADYAVASGEVTAQESGMKTRYQMGETVARQGAGGLAIGGGSQARVMTSELEIGQQDQALIRSNAARQAYGYEVKAAEYGAEATADTTAASNAKTSGYISAFGSLLGTAGSVASKWLGASKSGVFSGGGAGSSDPESLVT